MDLVFEVPLGPSSRVARFALLRELSGFDELVSLRGPVAATELLERLIVEAPGGVLRSADLWRLPLGERDRLVASVHSRHFGDRIESTVKCVGCGEAFAVDFSLDALVASLADGRDSTPPLAPDDNGVYALAEGRHFRLPTAEDERAISALSPSDATTELLKRCVVRSDDGNSGWIHAAMAQVGPVLDLELPARCALCGKDQEIHFDIVSFFLASLARERTILGREIHRLAATYHWGHEEILRLSRSQRRAYVALVEAERGRSRAAS